VLTVHHLNNSRSQRIVWLCEELGLDYELVKHQRNPETQRSPESLQRAHPLGKAPTIGHGGRAIVESEAIIAKTFHNSLA
jgi:glutathione S-transferase